MLVSIAPPVANCKAGKGIRRPPLQAATSRGNRVNRLPAMKPVLNSADSEKAFRVQSMANRASMMDKDRREQRLTLLILLAIILPCLGIAAYGMIKHDGGMIAFGFFIPIPLLLALIFYAGLYFFPDKENPDEDLAGRK